MTSGSLARLRGAGLTAIAAGAAGAVGFTVYAGRSAPRFLLALFLLWVLAPFVAGACAYVISQRWTVVTRATLYSLAPILAIASPVIYGSVALGPPRAQPAFVFVIVPPASSLLAAAAIAIAALVSGRPPRAR
jgi:hypothetical protein